MNRFIELCQRMRVANEQLRQQLASAMNENKQLNAKIGTATARLENLLSQIPEEES